MFGWLWEKTKAARSWVASKVQSPCSWTVQKLKEIDHGVAGSMKSVFSWLSKTSIGQKIKTEFSWVRRQIRAGRDWFSNTRLGREISELIQTPAFQSLKSMIKNGYSKTINFLANSKCLSFIFGTEETVEIQNETSTEFTITVSETDAFDWIGNEGPDSGDKFNKRRVRSRTTMTQNLNLNRLGSGNFVMTLTFANGTTDKFRIEELSDSEDTKFTHQVRSHIINIFTSDGKTVINVENTREQLQNEFAETLKNEALRSLALGPFEEAVRMFDDALEAANERETIESIRELRNRCYQSWQEQRRNEEAERLKNEGVRAMEQERFEEAVRIFDDALLLTNDAEIAESIQELRNSSYNSWQVQLRNAQAELLRNEGLTCMEEQRFEEAVRIFDEALEKTNQEHTKSSILENKNLCYDLWASYIIQQTRDMQDRGRSLREDKKFNDAEQAYREVLHVLEEAKLKIPGNKFEEIVAVITNIINQIEVEQMNDVSSEVQIGKKVDNKKPFERMNLNFHNHM